MVAAVAQELIEQVAIGAVHLDTVEPGRLGVLGGFAEPRHDARQFVVAQLARHFVGLLALWGVCLVVLDAHGAWRHGLRAAVEQRMAGAAAVPDLQNHLAALRMHGIGDRAPGGDLCRGVDAGFAAAKGRVSFDRHCRFGDDQAGRGALGVVLDHHRGRNVVGVGAAARKWRHHDAVTKLEVAEGRGGEQGGVVHGEGREQGARGKVGW